jgi:hypothetical protein
MAKLHYNDFLRRMSARMIERTNGIEAFFGFDYGREFEVILCEMLRRILPERFGVCLGHVVNKRGSQAGDDIIIFDQARFPTLRLHDRMDYSRKEWVPIEAVCAYVEAKHTLALQGKGKESLTRTIDQVVRVKQLCSRRESISAVELHPYTRLAAEHESLVAHSPAILNPLFTAIVSRKVRMHSHSEVLADAQVIHATLQAHMPERDFGPDMVIAGMSNLVVPVVADGEENLVYSPFYVEDVSHYGAAIAEDLSWGAGLAVLLYALDWIRLGKMPWQDLIGNALGFH